jgi:ArsR family transcriptional regulator, lead/cadmium/zinc/bismuth-responsive transcriptional repressor
VSDLSYVLSAGGRPAGDCPNPELVAQLRGVVLSPADAEELALTFSMLSDPTRARVLHALSLTSELCVLDLVRLLGVGQSGLSHQLRLLRDNRVVARRKAGRVAYYRLTNQRIRVVFTNPPAGDQRQPTQSRGRRAVGAGPPSGADRPPPEPHDPT